MTKNKENAKSTDKWVCMFESRQASESHTECVGTKKARQINSTNQRSRRWNKKKECEVRQQYKPNINICVSRLPKFIHNHLYHAILFIYKHTWADSFRSSFFHTLLVLARVYAVRCERMFECMFSDACACHSFSLSVFPSIRWIVARFACVWTITRFKLTHPHTKKIAFLATWRSLGRMRSICRVFILTAKMRWSRMQKRTHKTRMETRKAYNNADSTAWKWEFLTFLERAKGEYFSHFCNDEDARVQKGRWNSG